MAHIAIVETYPYEAVWGGEAAYLDRIRQFLASRGHEVESFVTDIARGRASPLVRLRSASAGDHRWTVRRAMPLGGGRFLSFRLSLFVRAVARSLGLRPRTEGTMRDDELAWLIDRLATARPDIVVLAFGASRLTRAVAAAGRGIVALPGFFSERVVRLGGVDGPRARAMRDPEMDSLTAATIAGLNNSADLEYYRSSTGANNGALVGMGFPRRRQAPPSDEPIVLFVGARTKPNVEALRWFVDGCWPAVLAGAPGARLRIVGSAGLAFPNGSLPRAETVGFVDDLAEEYARAQLVIAPLLVGTNGIKTKIVEALAHGRPLVTTSIGIDPADRGQFDEAVEVADDPGGFAAAIVRVLTDAPLRLARTTAAGRQFERHFCEDVAYAPLIRVLAPLERRG